MIASFEHQYHFLSNFYPCRVVFEDIEYPSSEHAYVAQKTLDKNTRIVISEIPSAGKVKRMGKHLDIRSDWDEVKLSIMDQIVSEKFNQNPYLMDLLNNTAPHELIEGNTWGDTFWGQSPLGNGRNELGKILMSIRDDITRRFQ